MKTKVDLFFTDLGRALEKPAEVIITGAAAAALFGCARPSLDIDFEIRPRREKDRVDSHRLDRAIQSCAEKTAIAVNYSEDISHWSMIDFLDYRENTLPYRKFGSLSVEMISPEHWTIGKMGRFFAIDINDMVKVIKKRKIKSKDLIQLWARAFRKSPASLEKRQFHDHVLDFLKREGKKAWGRNFDPEEAARLFKQAAGLAL